MAKWKKPGYERLCSTYVINTKNYKFGTTSICRVSPLCDRIVLRDGCENRTHEVNWSFASMVLRRSE